MEGVSCVPQVQSEVEVIMSVRGSYKQIRRVLAAIRGRGEERLEKAGEFIAQSIAAGRRVYVSAVNIQDF